MELLKGTENSSLPYASESSSLALSHGEISWEGEVGGEGEGREEGEGRGEVGGEREGISKPFCPHVSYFIST